MRRGKVKIITGDEFNHLKSQIVTSNDNLNLKSKFATLEKWNSLRLQNVTIGGRRYFSKLKGEFEGQLKEEAGLNSQILENLSKIKMEGKK
jgi:hypothetical protein